MLDHIGIYVDSLAESDKFYRPLLKKIGYEVIFERPQCIAYGVDGAPLFEIYTGKQASSTLHIAFQVKSKELVGAFHKEALILGAQDNGIPGYRDYCPGYYAAFVLDLNGHNLEAVYLEKQA